MYTWITLLGISIVYLVLIGPQLLNGNLQGLVVVNALLFVSSMLCLLLTGFTDPGIIPRREIWEADDGEVPAQLMPPTKEQVRERIRNSKAPPPGHNIVDIPLEANANLAQLSDENKLKQPLNQIDQPSETQKLKGEGEKQHHHHLPKGSANALLSANLDINPSGEREISDDEYKQYLCSQLFREDGAVIYSDQGVNIRGDITQNVALISDARVYP